METQITVPEEKIESLLVKAGELTVKEYFDVMESADLLQAIKAEGEAIEEHKKSITKPINDSLKKIRDVFKNAETAFSEAEELVKDKVLAWHQDAWAEGKHTNNTIEGSVGKVTVTARKKLVIEDESAIPKKFYKQVLDEEAIKTAILDGEEVTGAFIQEEYSITAGKK